MSRNIPTMAYVHDQIRRSQVDRRRYWTAVVVPWNDLKRTTHQERCFLDATLDQLPADVQLFVEACQLAGYSVEIGKCGMYTQGPNWGVFLKVPTEERETFDKRFLAELERSLARRRSPRDDVNVMVIPRQEVQFPWWAVMFGKKFRPMLGQLPIEARWAIELCHSKGFGVELDLCGRCQESWGLFLKEKGCESI